MISNNQVHQLVHALRPTASDVASPYFDEIAAAAYLGLGKPRRLAEFRRLGGGPRYFRCGQKPLYRRDWLDEWTEAGAVQSTAQEAARKRS